MIVTTYIVSFNERFDNISQKAYGSDLYVENIIRANPTMAVTDIVPLGAKINIPIIEITSDENKTTLPPWKQ